MRIPRPPLRDMSSRQTHGQRIEAAESLAVNALGWLAQDGERLERFLSLAGLAPDTLRQAAATPGFLAGVLAHLMSDESLLLAFAANEGLAPEDVARAARLLDPRDET